MNLNLIGRLCWGKTSAGNLAAAPGAEGDSRQTNSGPSLEIDGDVEICRNHAGLADRQIRIVAQLGHEHRLFSLDLEDGRMPSGGRRASAGKLLPRI